MPPHRQAVPLGKTFTKKFNFIMHKKIIYILILVLLTKFSYSQSNLYSNSVNVTDSSILMATSTKYKQFEFCIEKKNEIIKELKKLTYGKAEENKSEKFSVSIKLITKGKVINMWIASPTSSIIEVEKRKYLFDTVLLSVLHKKYPINYSVEEKVFTSQYQLDNYYETLLKDKTFLYIVPHDFESEWLEKFNLTFKKDEIFSSPKAISNYLKPKISKLVPTGKFSISYEPFGAAKKDSSNELTMTVESINELYNNFDDTNAKKGGLTFFPSYIIRKK